MARRYMLRLWDRLGEMPIRKKLLVILILTSATTLLLAGVGIVVSESVVNYQYLRRDLFTFAQVIGANTTGALQFEDVKVASENLAALRARTDVVSACVYRPDGTLLALYLRDEGGQPCHSPESEEGFHATLRGVEVAHPIVLQGSRVGTLVLLYDLREIYQRIAVSVLVVLALLAASSAIVLLFSKKLRAIIATPIQELEATANAVTKSKDYGIRAQRHSNDEVGRLVDQFNEMLASIQSRDKDLSNALSAQDETLSKLERSNDELRRSNEDLERFAFVASHDLQEPMRTIASYSQLLVRQHAAQLDPDAGKFVRFIVEGIQRMRSLVLDLLEYSRIAALREKEGTPVDLESALATAIANLRSAIQETGATITADRLPAFEANEGHVIPLFQNLIENAIKYRNSEPPRVHITVGEKDGETQFAVSDNGIGIDAEYHHKIFIAFQRLHGQDIPGTGIGLAICQRVVERYGGRIWVESQAGQGATFRFTLPNIQRHGERERSS